LQFDKDGSGSVTNADLSHRYLQADAVDQVLADEQVSNSGQASNVLWLLPDNEGSIKGIVSYDPSENVATVVNHIVYNSFGSVTSQTDAAINELYGYAGQISLPSPGLVQSGARIYDTATGSWMTQDPSGLGPDTNPYRYCGNDPIDETDPSGLEDAPSSGGGDQVLFGYGSSQGDSAWGFAIKAGESGFSVSLGSGSGSASQTTTVSIGGGALTVTNSSGPGMGQIHSATSPGAVSTSSMSLTFDAAGNPVITQSSTGALAAPLGHPTYADLDGPMASGSCTSNIPPSVWSSAVASWASTPPATQPQPPAAPITAPPWESSGSIGAPGFGESLIPIWGSGRAAINDFQNGNWGWGLFNSALAISDVFLVKSIATAGAKLVVTGGAKLIGRVGAEAAAGAAGAIGKDAMIDTGEQIVERIAEHHPWPQYLQGPAKQAFEELPADLHNAYHGGLDRLLPRRYGSRYYRQLSPADQAANFEKLRQYTQAFDQQHGTKLWDAIKRTAAALPGGG
jgi:RHS repeat-associated protein